MLGTYWSLMCLTRYWTVWILFQVQVKLDVNAFYIFAAKSSSILCLKVVLGFFYSLCKTQNCFSVLKLGRIFSIVKMWISSRAAEICTTTTKNPYPRTPLNKNQNARIIEQILLPPAASYAFFTNIVETSLGLPFKSGAGEWFCFGFLFPVSVRSWD